MEKQLELSQMSAWTSDEVNLNNKEVKHGAKRLIDKILKVNEPDREEMVETIITLRQQKNIHEEQIKLLKTTVFRMKKQIV